MCKRLGLTDKKRRIMMDLIETYHLTGVVVGALTFLIIGLFHPVVIKAEYYFGVRCWWLFLVLGVAGVALSMVVDNGILSVIFGVLAFSSLWSIGELFEQRKRVEKGWFPKNPKRG